MRFESPGYLALLVVLPLLVLISIKSLAGLGNIRRVLAITIRCIVVLCMILALAGAQTTQTNDELAVIFLLDRSNSIPRAYQQQAFEFIQQSIDGCKLDDRMGVIAFDGRSAVEQLPMGTLAIDKITEPVAPDETDLAAALRLAMALFPPDAARRIVLLSDGNENVGTALEEAEYLQTAGVPIDVIPIIYEHANEVVFEQLRAPPTANAEETINLQMVLRSQEAASGRILLRHNGQLVDLDPNGPGTGYAVELDCGANRYTIPIPLRVAGAHRFEATFEADDPAADGVVDNNEGQAFTVVSGQGRILILTTEDDRPSADLFASALESERLFCDVENAGSAPLDQVRLLDYSAVVLSNVPAGDLSEREHQALAVYVRELGGGLIMLGGEDSFGAGDWLGSTVEEVMPVSFDVKNMKQIPKGALVLVMHGCEIPNGNYLGERCAVNAVKTLSSRDLIGVLSWQYRGTDEGYWVVPLQTVGNKTAIIQKILKMQMGDMPDLDVVMRPGVEALVKRKDARIKHMIIMSDFDPQPPADDLLATMKKNGITCSTIGIGYGGHWINEGLADRIAKSTGGTFYRTNDHSKLPQIFVKESRVVQRSLIDETPFTPQLVNSVSQTVAGLVPGEIPGLEGYVVTTARPLAEVPLVRQTESGNDPVLAHWQVGLGKTVAFTSGMWDRWGAQWASWVQFSKFWAQIVRWVSRQAESAALDVTTSVQGGRGKIRIDALDKNADVIDFMRIKGALVTPAQEALPVRLTQTGPGRYEGEFDARERGSYVLNLEYQMGSGTAAISGALRTGVSVAYSPEYRELKPNIPLLDELCRRTGGRRYGRDLATSAFDHGSLPMAETRRTIWEDLIWWMLLLFLLDVAIRRIAISPLEMIRKTRQFLADRAGAGRKSAESSAVVLTTLKGTRERVRERISSTAETSEAGTPPARATRYEAKDAGDKATEDLARALGGATQSDAPVVARPTGKKTATTESDYTARLLEAKRRTRQDLKKDEKQD
ncbi:MAG: VWA domain-containing protein [Planctomycetota bacterium]